MDIDGSNKENLTKSDAYEKFPQFSKDGSFIIFQGWQKGKMEIYLIGLLDKEIINMTKSVTSNDIISHGNSFSANSQNIVFTSDRNGNKDIYTMNINGDSLQQITVNSSEMASSNPRFLGINNFFIRSSILNCTRNTYA